MPNSFIYLCDLDQSKSEALAKKSQVHGLYTSFDDLLLSEKPDTVHILTPPSTHAYLAEKAILSGCHIYIERPVTESAAEYVNLSELANKQGRIIYAGYSMLGIPAILRAREEIASGKLGRLIAVHCDFICAWPGNILPYGDPNPWAYSMTGGILQNMADHPASLVVNAIDGVQEHNLFFCRRNVLPNDCPDLMHVVIRNDEQIGSFTLSLGHGCGHRQVQYFLEGGIMVDTHGRKARGYLRRYIRESLMI